MVKFIASCDQGEKLYSSDLQAIHVGHGVRYEHESTASCAAFGDVCEWVLISANFGTPDAPTLQCALLKCTVSFYVFTYCQLYVCK